MTKFRLIWRSLVHFRRHNLAVLAGVAVTTAVLTGALVVGDSVSLSLRDLALARLGPVDAVLLCRHFFDGSLARRLDTIDANELPSWSQAFASLSKPHRYRALGPALILKGSACSSDDHLSAGDVQIGALPPPILSVQADRCIINQALADMLHAQAGQDILLTVPRISGAPFVTVFSRRQRDDQLARLRVTVERIVSGPSLPADFSLYPTQRPSPRVWLNLGAFRRRSDNQEKQMLFFIRPKMDRCGLTGRSLQYSGTAYCWRIWASTAVLRKMRELSLRPAFIFLGRWKRPCLPMRRSIAFW